MCACGDLSPSYICPRHQDTPDDPLYHLEEDVQPIEVRERDEDYRLFEAKGKP